MNGQVYTITPEQAAQWLDLCAMPWVNASRTLHAGMYDGKCLCIYGLIDTCVMNDTAYGWLWTAPDVPKIMFGRHAKRLVPILLSMYSEIICNCYNSSSAHWLESLGAEQLGPDLFSFRRQ